MPDVRMPDGTIIRNVPEGASRSQVEAAWRRSQDRNQRPKSFWQGLYEGVTDAATNALTYLEGAPAIGTPLKIAGAVMNAVQGQAPDPSVARTTRRARDRVLARSPYRSSTAGKIAGEVLGTLPAGGVPGVVRQGILAGGLTAADPNDAGGVARNVGLSVVGNKVGEQVGRRVLAPIAERVGRTQPARAIGRAVAALADKEQLPLPNITRPERTIIKTTREGPAFRQQPQLEQIRQNAADAAELGLPYSLADASPELRTLAGSVARYSPTGQATALRNYDQRALGQADRAVNAIDRYLAPVTDIKQRSADIIESGKPVYGPLYDEAYAAAPVTSAQIERILQTPAGRTAVGKANTIAANEFRDPRAMGFAVDDAGNAILNPVPIQEMDRLDAARQGWDAANAAYEAAVRRQQASLYPAQHNAEVQSAAKALAQANAEMDAAKLGMAQAPRSTDVQGQSAYTTQSLDYVKRGIDDILEPQRNPITGKLNLDEGGRAIAGVRASLLNEIDNLNPAYAQARDAYSQFAKRAEALKIGHEVLPSGSLPQRDFDAIISRATPDTLPEMGRGYATAMADTANRQRLSGNPFKAIYGSTDQRAKVGRLFPEGASRFARLNDLEDEMALTRAKVLGGSDTQARNVADQLFQNDVASNLLDAGLQASTGGGVPGASRLIGAAAQFARDRSNLGLFGAQKRADDLAPLLFSTDNPRGILDLVDDMARKMREQEVRRTAYRGAGGLIGLPIGVASTAGTR